MISEKCFGQEWISAKAMELRYPDKNVIERVVRAFSLLDMLARSGCPFVFKGGTSLMLLLQETGSRLSTDIDIICPPETNIETYLQEYAGFCSRLDGDSVLQEGRGEIAGGD